MQINMLKPARNTSPTVNFIFRQVFINVVCDVLMRYQHQVHLLVAAAVTLFRKILQQLYVTDRSIGNACLQIFAEFIINDVYTVKAFVLQLVNDLLIKLHYIKSEERIKSTTGCEGRIELIKLFIRTHIVFFQGNDKVIDRYIKF